MRELREKLRARLNEARAILDKAEIEKRGLTAAEQQQYEAATAAADTIKAEMRTAEDAERTRLRSEMDAMAPETQAAGAERRSPAGAGAARRGADAHAARAVHHAPGREVRAG
jgi:flagellar biosynthesis GTPase FlhF